MNIKLRPNRSTQQIKGNILTFCLKTLKKIYKNTIKLLN